MAVALAVKKWTLAELHRLPDDGNKYELIYGELFVTPAPSYDHETILAKLSRILDPYVAANGLGFVYHPRAVVQRKKSEVEPDLQVSRPHPGPRRTWRTAPVPMLVVEVHSPYTRRRDVEHKRRYYRDIGVAEYWMIDPEERTLTVVREGSAEATTHDRVTWYPSGASAPLTFEIADLFE
jgi:Uma2 family endonuclease